MCSRPGALSGVWKSRHLKDQERTRTWTVHQRKAQWSETRPLPTCTQRGKSTNNTSSHPCHTAPGAQSAPQAENAAGNTDAQGAREKEEFRKLPWTSASPRTPVLCLKFFQAGIVARHIVGQTWGINALTLWLARLAAKDVHNMARRRVVVKSGKELATTALAGRGKNKMRHRRVAETPEYGPTQRARGEVCAGSDKDCPPLREGH